MAGEALALEHVSVGFAARSGAVHPVLDDVSLAVADGDFVAIVGPSGCGKSTLLNLAAGLIAPPAGAIRVFGERLSGVNPHAAYLFQQDALLPWRSVLDNLRLAAPKAGAEDLTRIAADLGLAEHLSHFPGELSLGLARRVALARAFAVKPDLLVLDEPFVSLDAVLAVRLRGELAALVDRTKVTTLLVTHDIEEAIRLADHIMLLKGPPAKIIAAIDIEHPRQSMTEDYAAATKAEIRAILAKAHV